jgi:hypothetical protein
MNYVRYIKNPLLSGYTYQNSTSLELQVLGSFLLSDGWYNCASFINWIQDETQYIQIRLI